MAKRSVKIRVGYILTSSSNWIGGFNYIKNLLFAIKNNSDSYLTPIVFIPTNYEEKYKTQLIDLCEVNEVTILNKNSIFWIFWKITKKITNSDFFLELYLLKYKIQIFSHSSVTNLIKSKNINWIADFQHLRLPHMFNSDEIIQRNRNIENLISFSNILLLSSKSALSDFQNFYQENNRVRVLQFVSQPGPFQEYDESRLNVIKLKYNIEGDYFIVPNQLWKHKNHIVIINALNYLKQKGLNIKVVFTGLLNDYRDKTHAEFIKNVIKNYNVDILLLGLINYEDVISLIKGSIAVINPSLFEGWSTTVEECKSLGKNIILSNIPVHKEQAPEYAIYFNPEDYLELANIIQYHFINNKSISHLYNISEYDQKLKERTTNFYNNYLKIVKELL